MKINLNTYFKKKNNLKPLIVAEISANHNGSKKVFLNSIKSAAKNGADLVKIQTYEADDISINKKFLIGNKKTNIWKLYKKAQTPYSWHHDAFKLSKKLGIELFSTPFSLKAVKFLKKFKVKLFKISSFEITDLRLVEEIAKTKKPVILSTGMASLKEIKKCIKTINKYHKKIILLHCVSGYPTSEKQSNLRRINSLKKVFNYNVGLSDHTDDIITSLTAVSLNAVLIEKHFIVNKAINSLDKKFSIDPRQLLSLNKMIERVKDSLGSGNFQLQNDEKKSIKYRRSIFSIKRISKGEKLTTKNISTFRPKIGLPADKFKNILGKRLKKSLVAFSPIFKKDLFN